MPYFTLEITSQGPILNAVVGVSRERHDALTAAKCLVPKGVHIRALLDTGASKTCVDPSVTKALELTATGSTKVNTASTKSDEPAERELYDISLWILAPENQSFLIPHTLPVICTELPVSQEFHALIGRDVLSQCMLVYNGSAKWFTLGY